MIRTHEPQRKRPRVTKPETAAERERRLYRSRRRAAIARAERWANSLMQCILDAGRAIHGDWLVDRFLEEKARQLKEFERREQRRREEST